MKKSLVYTGGVFYEIGNAHRLSSKKYTVSNLHQAGDFIEIFIDESSLTTNFIASLNKIQIQTGMLYSLRSLKENDSKKSKVINDLVKVSVFLRKKNQLLEDTQGVSYYSRKETTVKNLKSLLSVPNSVFSFMLDGSNWRIHLSDGMILGKKRNSVIESTTKYPYHVQESLKKEADSIIYSDDFNATHIFLNSCSDSLVDKSLYGKNLNVAMNLLANTPSVISGYRMKNGDESENLLHTLLILNGYNIPEIHYILNVNATLQLNETSPYINFGDVNNEIKKNDNEESQVEIECLKDNWRIQYNESKEVRYFECNLTVSRDAINKLLSRELYLFSDISEESVYFSYIPYPKTNTVKCIWYSYNQLKTKSFQVSLGCLVGEKSVGKYLLDVTNNIQNFNYIGINSNKLKNKIDDFTRNVVSKIVSIPPVKFNNLLLREFRKSEELLYKGIEPLIKKTMEVDYPIEHFHNKSILTVLSSNYGEQLCPNCHSKVFVKESKAPLSSTIRFSGICRTCDNPFDMTDLSKKEKLITCKVSSRKNLKILDIQLKNINKYSSSSYYIFFAPSTGFSSKMDDIEIINTIGSEGYHILNEGESLNFQVKFKREFSPTEVEKYVDFNIYIIENGNLEFYSTKIIFQSRSKIPRFEKLKTSIVDYLVNYLPEEKVEHSINLADKVKELATLYDENIYEAEISALLLNSANEFSKNKKLENILIENGILTETYGIKLTDAQVAKNIAEQIFGIDNSKILSAIYWQTNGRESMTLLEQIIFVSVYLSDTKNVESYAEIEEIAENNLDLAVDKIIEMRINN